MLEPSFFTADFEVMEGAPLKPSYIGTYFEVVPNAPPIPTSYIESSDGVIRFNFTLNPPLPGGSHDLKLTNENFFFRENLNQTTVVDGNLHIEIDSLKGQYVGTFDATLLDRFGRELKIVNGRFEINVVPQ